MDSAISRVAYATGNNTILTSNNSFLEDGSWSNIDLHCPGEPYDDWVISPNNIVVICSVSVITIIFVIIVSVIFTRKRRLGSKHRSKLSRLRHQFDSNTRVNYCYCQARFLIKSLTRRD